MRKMFSEEIVKHSIPSTNICEMDEDSLAHIFQYLRLEDLDQLARVCKRFYLVVNTYFYAKRSAKLLLTGHQRRSVNFPCRDRRNFSFRKRISLFENWCYGRYREKQFFYHKTIYFSQIVLESGWLYMTHRGQLRAHERTKRDNILRSEPMWTLGNGREPDISWIVKKSSLFFAGRSDGSCFIYNCDNRRYGRQQLEDSFVTSVDFEDDLFVCTTKAKSTSFWTNSEQKGQYVLQLKRELDDGYQTIKLCPDGGIRLAGGKYHDREKNALKLIDVESGVTSTINSPTRAVYHLLWRDSQTILTGNFDTTLRMVDTRTLQDEAVWTDPYDASVYCLDYDGAYGVLCGMKYNFRVNLYDLRVPKRCVQMYFSSKMTSNYSPAYSLAADSSQLFLVTDHDLRVLNFDADSAETKDYTSDLVKWLY